MRVNPSTPKVTVLTVSGTVGISVRISEQATKKKDKKCRGTQSTNAASAKTSLKH